jgi:hypothetical protein
MAFAGDEGGFYRHDVAITVELCGETAKRIDQFFL